MGWQETATWQWWLEHGFDGIGAGIVGGLVTAGAVWLTIRHERKLRTNDVREARMAELRLSVIDMQQASFDLRDALLGGPTAGKIARLFAAASAVEALAHSLAPALSRDMNRFCDALVKTSQLPDDEARTQMRELTGRVFSRLYGWLADPETYNGLPPAEWEHPGGVPPSASDEPITELPHDGSGDPVDPRP